MLSPDWLQEHEAPGGKFANGVIVRQYAPGDTVTVTSHITANHVVRGSLESTCLSSDDYNLHKIYIWY